MIDTETTSGALSTLRLDSAARKLAAATRDDPEAYSFTAWHEMTALSPFDRYLLPLLDGTHSAQS